MVHLKRNNKWLGFALIAFAIAFNLPFSILGATFDYPDILRQSPHEILSNFRNGGTALILTWHAFAWAALLFIPISISLGLTDRNWRCSKPLALSVAITGALSGLAQAIGLLRWVFVAPVIAKLHESGSDETRETAALMLSVLNSYGGVAVGEHLGQWLLVFFALSLSILQQRQGARFTASLGVIASMTIATGTTEGLMIALGKDGAAFALLTVAGFILFTFWLISTGVSLARERTSVC